VQPIPISVSPDAVDWITELLLLCGYESWGTAGLIPVLSVGWNRTV
jgi:hypothetical protein